MEPSRPPLLHPVPQVYHLSGKGQFPARPSIEDAGAVGILRNAHIIVARGLDGEYVHLRVHCPPVGKDQVEDIDVGTVPPSDAIATEALFLILLPLGICPVTVTKVKLDQEVKVK